MASAKEQYLIPSRDRYIIPLFILVVMDTAVFIGSFILAYALRFSPLMMELVPPPEIPPLRPYFVLSIAIAALGILVFERFGFYLHRYGLERRSGPIGLVAAVIVSYVFIMAILFNYRGMSFSRLTVAFSLPITSVLICGAHVCLHRIHEKMVENGIAFSRTALIGPFDRCTELLRKMHHACGSEYHVLGYIGMSQEGHGKSRVSLPLLGNLDNLVGIIKENRLDRVILDLPKDNPGLARKVINTCREQNVQYQLVPELFDVLTSLDNVEEAGVLPTILLDETPLAGQGFHFKRIFDVVIAGSLLVTLSPIMALVALLIKLDSTGEVIYCQERIGNDGRFFTMYKFRTMTADAENDTGPIWAKADDPRCTRVGRLLRRTNLDELPQFLNVVRGDMSVVGPRPERPYFVNKFKNAIPGYMRRHVVKSGITGWAQVNGLRGDTSVEERTRFDMYYIKHWSILLDIKILWRTLTSFKNAY